MTNKRKISIFFSIPILFGTIVLFAFIHTCQRIEPELILEITTYEVGILSGGEEYKLNGSIICFGEEEITQHGFCWSVNTEPTITGTSTKLGRATEKGTFTSTISDLSSDKKYYVRAYAITSSVTVYGDEKTFTTPALVLATLSTTAISNVTINSSQSGGNITDDGGASVTARGVCWSTSPIPTISKPHTTNGNGIGDFSSNITGLSSNMTYYVRAYATNSVGTAYGNERSFITLESVSFPVVSTELAIDVTETSATLVGDVISDGGATITARGFYWSNSANPDAFDNNAPGGIGTGIYNSPISGLSPNTTYYMRAYAGNSKGTSYGDVLNFTTLQSIMLPDVSTSGITEITQTTCSLGGNVTDDGGATVIERGVCWSTSSSPTISGSHTIDGSGTGYFSSTITGLSPNTSYYTRAYATNSAGTNYGDPLLFTTPEEIVQDINGNVYQTVQIGNQKWMAENLKVTHYSDGSAIPLMEDSADWVALADLDIAYCWYDNSNTNRDVYGGLYTWAAAMNGAASSITNPSGVQGVCPNGWHLPSELEWTELISFLGGESVAGGRLKEAGFTHWSSPNTGATNESGFTALPGGRRKVNGSFQDLGYYTYIWRTDAVGEATEIGFNTDSVYPWYEGSSPGYSVRCVKD